MADSSVKPEIRARFAFALSHVLDARGEFSRAQQAGFARPTPSPSRPDSARMTLFRAIIERFVDNILKRFDADFFARTRGSGLAIAPAGLHLRPAAIGHLADRAGPRQPPADARRRRVAAGPAVVRGDTAVLGRNDLPMECVPDLDAASRSAGWPSCTSNARGLAPATRRGSSTRCPTTTSTSACWRLCFPEPSSSIAGATSATWPSHAG